MKTHQAFLKRMTKLGLLLILGVSISACSGDQKWKEEVQLSDGRVIVVERELLTEGGGDELAFNHSGVKPKEYRIRSSNPDKQGEMIEWHSTKTDSQTWPELPLILDVESRQPVVFSIVAISDGWKIYSKYVYHNGAWIEETLPSKFEARLTNLFLKTGVNMPSFVNLETKRKINSSVDYRQSLKQVGPNRQVAIH